MSYKTQMEAAKKGIVTKEMEIVAQKEQMDTKELMELVAKGTVAIPVSYTHLAMVIFVFSLVILYAAPFSPRISI